MADAARHDVSMDVGGNAMSVCVRSSESNGSCDDTQVVIKCNTLNGEELGVVTVDGDATTGQFKARLLLATGRILEWFEGKKFVMGEPPTTFEFSMISRRS